MDSRLLVEATTEVAEAQMLAGDSPAEADSLADLDSPAEGDSPADLDSLAEDTPAEVA